MKQYNKTQITKTISYWANYLLENKMVSDTELTQILGEGWIRRIGHGIKHAWNKTKDIAHEINWLPQKMFDKVFKSNNGIVMLMDTMNQIQKTNKIPFEDIGVYAVIDRKTYPVVDFASLHHKTVLLLLIDKNNTSTQPCSLGNLKEFFGKLGVHNIKSTIDTVRIGEAPPSFSESIILEESNIVTRIIEANKWTKKQAMKPQNIKALQKASKQSEKNVVDKINKYFATKKPSKSKPKALPKNKKKTYGSSSSSAPMPPAPSRSSSNAPASPTPPPDFGTAGTSATTSPNALKVFDNQLIKVVAKERDDDVNIGFIFTKSKAEIAIDKKYAELFS